MEVHDTIVKVGPFESGGYEGTAKDLLAFDLALQVPGAPKEWRGVVR